MVFDRLRAALPSPEYRLYPNAEWLGPMREGGPARDGEADLVVVNEVSGLLVLEVKSGAPSRDHAGGNLVHGRMRKGVQGLFRGLTEQRLAQRLDALADAIPSVGSKQAEDGDDRAERSNQPSGALES